MSKYISSCFKCIILIYVQTNARIAAYVDPTTTVWNKTTTAGTTIKSALDFALTLNAATSNEEKYVQELYPNVAAVGAVYGDADGKYVAFLEAGEPAFMGEAYILWNQPFALNEASGTVPVNVAASGTLSTAKSTKTAKAASTTSSASSVSVMVSSTVVACVSSFFFGVVTVFM